jgi:Tfp pilus assembly protein PilF
MLTHHAYGFASSAFARGGVLSLHCPLGAGDKEGAIADYQQAIKLNPSLKAATEMLQQTKAKLRAAWRARKGGRASSSRPACCRIDTRSRPHRRCPFSAC